MNIKSNILNKFLLFIFLFLFSFSFSFTYANADKSVIFYFPNGLPLLSNANMILDSSKITDSNGTKKLEYYIDDKKIEYIQTVLPDELVASLLKKIPDIAIVPSNVTAQLYNNGLGYRILGTVGWGSFYIVGKNDVTSFSEIKNKTIYAMGKGLTPDIILISILKENGINPEQDVNIQYFANAEELLSVYLTKNDENVLLVLPEPNISNLLAVKSQDIKILFDLNKEWQNITKSSNGYPQSALIVKEDFYNANSDFIEFFVTELEKSTKAINNSNSNQISDILSAVYLQFYFGENFPNINLKDINPDSLSLRNPFKFFNENSIKRTNIKFIIAKDSVLEYNIYFNKIAEHNIKVIGGSIPDEKIFIIK
ncbi:MAG: ABC transporter substrate-binding protein [Fusobacteriaceae bacterium]|jgi:NitT/TauT family transport system substrate-binding protein|nr:ABC transporter substrate-binding protein [Fusobacteriaceae bacterium]